MKKDIRERDIMEDESMQMQWKKWRQKEKRRFQVKNQKMLRRIKEER